MSNNPFSIADVLRDISHLAPEFVAVQEPLSGDEPTLFKVRVTIVDGWQDEGRVSTWHPAGALEATGSWVQYPEEQAITQLALQALCEARGWRYKTMYIGGEKSVLPYSVVIWSDTQNIGYPDGHAKSMVHAFSLAVLAALKAAAP